MPPKITDMVAWQQAELLMQPALLRVVDNIRKQLENSDWTGTYEDVQTPIPGYNLCLQHQDQQIDVDVWELCYEVCFLNYKTHSQLESPEVAIDSSLLDLAGDVDWQRLEAKTQAIISALFASLPTY
ncbi:MAG: hypothetical protein EBE86_026605 [Hormoscilla sp. GUM202]|nr:hypothetical protein [Hormoscilla sp. GUM202]